MSKDYAFTLNRHEQQSHLWKKIQAHFDYVLERERRKNDNKMDEDQTAAIRGKIALAKELKALDVMGEKEEAPDSEE